MAVTRGRIKAGSCLSADRCRQRVAEPACDRHQVGADCGADNHDPDKLRVIVRVARFISGTSHRNSGAEAGADSLRVAADKK